MIRHLRRHLLLREAARLRQRHEALAYYAAVFPHRLAVLERQIKRLHRRSRAALRLAQKLT